MSVNRMRTEPTWYHFPQSISLMGKTDNTEHSREVQGIEGKHNEALSADLEDQGKFLRQRA